MFYFTVVVPLTLICISVFWCVCKYVDVCNRLHKRAVRTESHHLWYMILVVFIQVPNSNNYRSSNISIQEEHRTKLRIVSRVIIMKWSYVWYIQHHWMIQSPFHLIRGTMPNKRQYNGSRSDSVAPNYQFNSLTPIHSVETRSSIKITISFCRWLKEKKIR